MMHPGIPEQSSRILRLHARAPYPCGGRGKISSGVHEGREEMLQKRAKKPVIQAHIIMVDCYRLVESSNTDMAATRRAQVPYAHTADN